MFSNSDSDHLNCMDLGAGTGILSLALACRYGKGVTVHAIELDEKMSEVYRKELSTFGINFQLKVGDVLALSPCSQYDKVILNPPYKKMAAKDPRQKVLPAKCANLYAAFVIRAIQYLKPNGECVAIIPRSWMNGEYFSDFRRWIFEHASIEWMHIYGSRSEIFQDSNILQETMLVKFVKRGQSPKILVTESENKNDRLKKFEYPAGELIDRNHKSQIVRIRPNRLFKNKKLLSLKDWGLIASTGKVVDFRLKDNLRTKQESGTVPLVYPCNFSREGFFHPLSSGKMQWFSCSGEKEKKLLVGPGAFVVVKRFSSKEEEKRVKAFAFRTTTPVALENHLNFIHAGSSKQTLLLNFEVAKGLSIWLNSSLIDDLFRSVSGSTQVNASDLNSLPIPEVNSQTSD